MKKEKLTCRNPVFSVLERSVRAVNLNSRPVRQFGIRQILKILRAKIHSFFYILKWRQTRLGYILVLLEQVDN